MQRTDKNEREFSNYRTVLRRRDFEECVGRGGGTQEQATVDDEVGVNGRERWAFNRSNENKNSEQSVVLIHPILN